MKYIKLSQKWLNKKMPGVNLIILLYLSNLKENKQ